MHIHVGGSTSNMLGMRGERGNHGNMGHVINNMIGWVVRLCKSHHYGDSGCHGDWLVAMDAPWIHCGCHGLLPWLPVCGTWMCPPPGW